MLKKLKQEAIERGLVDEKSRSPPHEPALPTDKRVESVADAIAL